mmetsp:Transcript_1559/g.2207  ORF Transcript_1559/g.2207 Transcript_1559/m.2207 type:complete len:110 (-) Transcript_1559:261-590(-)|eukprot:CAMPEP_0198147200 /NCGR_PEP_ID=MMETSP1443-20131203/33780_1 /TAXON_ID=186043 /ORGANISM="Entomoneis sp., Strain CCMP2396" /LENGTH=109 /DNA_ID=CAMNT_0043811401 /DNA_START=152 /DNA_END=481 /DNA_ORIENTATION=+
MKGAFAGGALFFKGDKHSKKKKSKSKHKAGRKDLQSTEGEVPKSAVTQPTDQTTEAERKAMLRKKERERKDLEKLAQKSHRETIEEFNEKLGNLTELNDIPRVSAAGNG